MEGEFGVGGVSVYGSIGLFMLCLAWGVRWAGFGWVFDLFSLGLDSGLGMVSAECQMRIAAVGGFLGGVDDAWAGPSEKRVGGGEGASVMHS